MAEGPDKEMLDAKPGPVGVEAGTVLAKLEPGRAEEKDSGGAVGMQPGAAGGENSSSSGWREGVELLVRAGFWALLIYLFGFQVSLVNGNSMLPNFHGDDKAASDDVDKLLIDKLTYRFAPVKRFDVVVFEAIDQDKQPKMARDYIKRVIGLPGETVQIRSGLLWINGRRVEENFGKEPYTLGGPELGRAGMTFKVPAGHYFVMGDNRGGSHDSRAPGLGYVPAGQIKGLVRMRWWPWARRSWFSRQTD
jgi:signal peptidase I